ncbi:MAG: hypothetical protein KDG50_08350 [Chromatiales bacterium]|nr:hypothetical protein [Chromatiales bacterium]
MNRRAFVFGSLATGACLLASRPVLSIAGTGGIDLKSAFGAATEPDIVRALFGDAQPQNTDQIELDLPMVANGQKVTVKVHTELADVDAIAITVPGNERPLCAFYRPMRDAASVFETAVRLRQTSAVTAYVRSRGQVFVRRRLVKLAVSGFGS